MAVYDFDVTVAEVLERVPGASPDRVGPNTEPISESDVEEAIEEGSSEMAGALSRNGPAPKDLDDEAKVQLQKAVRDGAAASLMSWNGATGEVQQDRQDAFDEARERYTDSSEIDGHTGGRVASNIADDESESDFIGNDFEM